MTRGQVNFGVEQADRGDIGMQREVLCSTVVLHDNAYQEKDRRSRVTNESLSLVDSRFHPARYCRR